MPKRISEKELFKTKIFTIKELEIELDSGKKITRQGDEEEPLEIVLYPFAKFENLITQKKMTDARMIAALYLTRSFLGGSTI